MARLQILELPEGAGDDQPPFVLVVDEWDVDTLETNTMLTEYWDAFGKKIGAQGVLFVDRTIDIPANDTSAYRPNNGASNEVTLKLGDHDVRSAIAADMQRNRDAHDKDAELRAANECISRLNAERDEARQWARHGYEIGQKHCGWSDHGFAPAWLTEGWPPHIDSCENLKHAAALDEALCSIRSVHAPVEHRGQIICKECSGLDPEGRSTDNASVLHEQCPTSRIACAAQSTDA